METNSKTVNFRLILSILVFIGMLGAVKPVLFNGGSSTAKYFAKKNQLQMVSEEKAEDYFEAVVFGEGQAELTEFESEVEENRTHSVESVYQIDKWIAGLLLFGTALLLIPKVLNSPAYHLLLINSIWLICLSIALSLNGGKRFSELALAAHATRWGLPLLLWWVIFNYRKGKDLTKDSNPAVYLLLICCSLTFAVHGWEAFCLNPPFQDLIYGFGNFLGISISTDLNSAILKTVGCMDLILAGIIFFVRSPKIFMWMAFWGIITATSRPLTLGIEAWPELAMRIANCGLPLMLYLLYRKPVEKLIENQTEEIPMEVQCEQT